MDIDSAAGGTDTSVTAVTTFVAILLLFPDVQAKAQAEIDAVIGRHRLPDLEDKPQLPYLNAVVKEMLRWQPIVPIGLPHMTSEEDVYRGYYIPKGAIVMGNSWSVPNASRLARRGLKNTVLTGQSCTTSRSSQNPLNSIQIDSSRHPVHSGRTRAFLTQKKYARLDTAAGNSS
jgi:hypothetical protein